MPRDYSQTDFSELRTKGYATETIRRRIRRERLSRESPILYGWAEFGAVLHLSIPAVKLLARSGALPLYTNRGHGRHRLVAFRDELLGAYRDHVLTRYTHEANIAVQRRVGLLRTLTSIVETFKPLLGRHTRPPSLAEWQAAAQHVSHLAEELLHAKNNETTAPGKFQPGGTIPQPNKHRRPLEPDSAERQPAGA